MGVRGGPLDRSGVTKHVPARLHTPRFARFSGDERLDFSKILGDTTRIESAVSQFADDGNWTQELFDGLGKKRTGLAGKNRNRNARVESDAIATHED